jgi:hypothetical protein
VRDELCLSQFSLEGFSRGVYPKYLCNVIAFSFMLLLIIFVK